MKLPNGAMDGAQPRDHVLRVLRTNGVEVELVAADIYELTDSEGDPLVMHLPDPVLSAMIVFLYRRFALLHDFLITDLVLKN